MYYAQLSGVRKVSVFLSKW